jgi:8-oxo-dGTP diphosphatase
MTQFQLTMHCLSCIILEMDLSFKGHGAAAWLSKDTLDSVKWLPMDLVFIEKLKKII